MTCPRKLSKASLNLTKLASPTYKLFKPSSSIRKRSFKMSKMRRRHKTLIIIARSKRLRLSEKKSELKAWVPTKTACTPLNSRQS